MPLKILQPGGTCHACEHRTQRLFCNLAPEALAAFEAIGTSARFTRGATLFREGETATAVHVICAGQIKLSCVSPQGKTMILKIAGPGDLLGLGATLAGLPYEVTAESIEPIEVRHLGREAFLQFLKKHGQASLNAAQSMQSEYRNAFLDARLLALTSTAAGRLAHVLLGWAASVSCGTGELRFNMALTHEEIGNMANLSRETVSRLLTRFRREKLIAVRGIAVTLLAPERLRELAQQ